MVDFFLYVTVLNPSASGNTLGPEGEIPATEISIYEKVVPTGIEIVG
jgi:hypothetical protein